MGFGEVVREVSEADPRGGGSGRSHVPEHVPGVRFPYPGDYDGLRLGPLCWGSYWHWDPKETWSLITWIIYALMLHARYVRGWRGLRMAIMTTVGFASVLFTYLGVNLLPGLHTYLQ